jgi:hypothetical protein
MRMWHRYCRSASKLTKHIILDNIENIAKSIIFKTKWLILASTCTPTKCRQDVIYTMCPVDTATAGSWAGVGLVNWDWICCGIGGTYSILSIWFCFSQFWEIISDEYGIDLQICLMLIVFIQSFSDPAISSDSDSDWSPKFGLGLGLGLKKSWLSYSLTQNYQSMKYLWRFNYSRYLCMWFIKGIIGFKKRKKWNFEKNLWNVEMSEGFTSPKFSDSDFSKIDYFQNKMTHIGIDMRLQKVDSM